jgi:Kef-type K+ transport system membrane component KefB/DNA-binding CsgD family transcriptional regulator
VTEVWALAALWLGLALLATLVGIWLRISTALSEIVIGTVAQLVIGAFIGLQALGAKAPWITFLSGTGAIVLTFLAGAELDPVVFRTKWKEASWLGLVAFFAPFFGCAALAHYLLHWGVRASWLVGIALSTTSVAVVYAVMLEFGLNKTEYGKTLLAACFINDLGTVIALGLIFAPFTFRTVLFAGVSAVLFFALPWLTPWFFRKYGGRVSELEAKYLLFFLFGFGALASWAESEAVLPAYIIGMVLAGTVGKDHVLIRRLRTMTFGLLTPFYFIRAGAFVSIPALIAAPLICLALLAGKMEGLGRRLRVELVKVVPGRVDGTDGEPPPVVEAAAPADPFGLTTREREVLALVAEGYTNRRIADDLFISESTAGVHVSHILAKLGVDTRTEAAAVAVRLGLDRASGSH